MTFNAAHFQKFLLLFYIKFTYHLQVQLDLYYQTVLVSLSSLTFLFLCPIDSCVWLCHSIYYIILILKIIFIIIKNTFYIYYCHFGDVSLHYVVGVGTILFHLCISRAGHSTVTS